MKTMSATLASKEFGRFIDAAQREPEHHPASDL